MFLSVVVVGRERKRMDLLDMISAWMEKVKRKKYQGLNYSFIHGWCVHK